MNCCRACNGTGKDYNELFKVDIILGEMLTLGEMLSFCANIEVNPNENHLPQHICNDCLKLLAISYQFKKAVIETDKLQHTENVLHVVTENSDEQIMDVGANEHIVQEDMDLSEEVLDGGEKKQMEKQKNELNDVDGDRSEECIEEIPFNFVDFVNNIENVSTPRAEEELVAVNEQNDKHYLNASDLSGIICESSVCYELENVENNVESDDHNRIIENNHLRDVNEKEQLQVVDNNETDVDDEIVLLKRPLKTRNRQAKKEKIFNPKYKCTICGKQLSHYNSMKYHMQLHSDETPFVCTICNLGFKTRNAYSGHISTHNPNNPNKCNICGKCYRQSSSLRSHMLIHTGEKPFTCTTCGKGMTQKSSFKKHMLIHTGEMPHICNICNRRFRYSSNLSTHRCRQTTEKALNINIKASKNDAEEECEEGYEDKADGDGDKDENKEGGDGEICGKYHVITHTDLKPQQCNICTKIFRTTAGLSAHKRIHAEGKPFICEEIGHGFNTLDHMRQHKLTHSGERSYSCSLCDKNYLYLSSLRSHMNSHTGIKPFTCEICGMGLTQKSGYKKHMLVHSGEKPHKCPICGRCFAFTSNLNAHVRLHSGEKPFKCDNCPKCFPTKKRLERHRIVHNKIKSMCSPDGQSPFHPENVLICDKQESRSKVVLVI